MTQRILHTFDYAEAYSEPSKISKIVFSAKIIDCFWPLTISIISSECSPKGPNQKFTVVESNLNDSKTGTYLKFSDFFRTAALKNFK